MDSFPPEWEVESDKEDLWESHKYPCGLLKSEPSKNLNIYLEPAPGLKNRETYWFNVIKLNNSAIKI